MRAAIDNKCSSIDWLDTMKTMDTQEAWEFFKTVPVFQDIIDKYVPITTEQE